MAPSRATLRVRPPPAGFAGAATVVTAVLVAACALTATLVSGYLQDDETPEEVLGLAGGEVSLPCGTSQFPGLAADDEPILVLWFREGSATPILSADARRGGGLANAKVWKDDAWEARFTLRPVGLVLPSLRADQQGVYVCRVDFRQAQTLNRLVRLTVIVPPRAVIIRDSRGRPLNGSVTAIDGQSLSLLCTAPGGRPPATLSWWRESRRLEDVLVPGGDGTGDAASQLAVGPLGRRDLHAQLVCRASNNNISEPLSASVVIDLILGPTSVSIVGATHALEAGRPGQLRCVSSGSRPPAQLSWWKGSQRLPATTTTTEAGGAIDGPASSSTLTLTPSVEDDGRQITCRAFNERLPQATVEDVATIRVLYKPQLVVRLGNRLRQSSILENHDVYLECSVAANPPVSEISWLFEGRDLHTNTSAGIIISNRSLVLQKVGRSARGHYHCVAANSLGQSRSEPLFLRVQFAPVCHESQKLIYGAARHEPLQVTCDVDADPPEVTFHWHLNHSMETAIPHSMQGATRSVATFIARSEADYGALSCEARNSVGPQRRPCLFSVVPAGPPEPPGLCALANQTEEAFQVRCIEGHHGGLPQHFVLEIHDSGGRFRGNVTSPMPYFEVSDLPSGSEFVLVVYAANGKGRSPPVLLTAATLPAAAESLLHQGPDASWQIKFSPVLAVLMALVLGFALLAFVVVAAVRLWSRHSFHKDANGASRPGGLNVGALWLAGSKMPSPEERPWIPPAPDVVDRIQVSPKNETTEMDTFVSAKGLCMATLDQDQSVINTFMQR
ncbi:nephrin [Dermacentor silvarum]|uniref:nephrin n=1 Tax=Dermacentor silvarum TaxID=543639 RepID=UPI00189C491D|nr:nephrin [Dermacentor silvarum]